MKDFAQFTLPSKREVPDQPDAPTEYMFWHTSKGTLWMSIFGLSIVGALVIGFFLYREGVMTFISIPISTPTPQISATPTREQINRSFYTIEILNGSGVEGVAAKVKNVLEKERFTVVTIGNGDRADYSKTIIQVKNAVPKALLDSLKQVLETSYVLDETQELNTSSSVDVVIIIGRQMVESLPQ